MKNTLNIFKLTALCAISLLFLNACNDFLDEEPLSNITPDNYLNEESQLAAYAINLYDFNTPNFQQANIIAADINSDNQASVYSNVSRFVPGQFKVGQTGGDWEFSNIYRCNYFLRTVLPKWKTGEITGNSTNIDHYIGEIYLLRSYNYFLKLQALGDFPIVRTILPDQKDVLTEASKRSPRNEVARFILSDLDSAIILMRTISPDGKNNRLSKSCAQLFSSRVALYEGTWLKYFKNTAFVPNGPGWPGQDKDYNAGYNFPSGSIDGEIDFFLTKAMSMAKEVADVVPLTENTGILQQSPSEPINPFYDMFCQTDMSIYPEVLLWRDYDMGVGEYHNQNEVMHEGSINITRGFVDNFLMANGLPVYDPSSGYVGDDSVHMVRIDRDSRINLFLKEPGQLNVLYPTTLDTWAVPVEPYPTIITAGGAFQRSSTGYNIRKGLNFHAETVVGNKNTTGIMVFRAAEAYLNYIEACYEKNGNLDGTAQSYWQSIRTRAGVDPDFNKTIAATDMAEEQRNDWAAYSAGQLVNATLYNIRRERRCEFLGEGMRLPDLLRWRAMDQMISTPYHIEGFKLWGPMQNWYAAGDLKYGIGDASNVSDPTLSDYLRPYEINPNFVAYDGFRWNMAHYLNPIAVQHFLITADNVGSVSSSPIYQNPGWPIVAGEGPTE
ncbi:MAG: RagB/SusD family nutrient uptake outer membrane protein [Bacteroidales bacterium]|nr:RagB/SusD family nutrient uptake outer membrane protein [Bacteroidales bacterium]